MKNVSFIFLLLVSSLVSPMVCAGDIKKWVDEKGNVHYGDKPPKGQSTESVKVNGNGSATNVKMDKDFLLGKWRTDAVVYNGKTIPPLVHIFDKTTVKIEGESVQLEISSYTYANSSITVTFGKISQTYTIINQDTMSYTSLAMGKQLLHRMK